MGVRYVTFKETVELFLNTTFMSIWDEDEVPRVNFIFQDDAYLYFKEVMKNPFYLKGSFTPNIDKTDINNLKNYYDPNVPTIKVKNYVQFFGYIRIIANNYSTLNHIESHRFVLIKIMRRIWLRMSPSDFNNVENFLKKQCEFINNDAFDKYMSEDNSCIVDKIKDYSVMASVGFNSSHFETFRHMHFYIKTNDNMPHYNLPSVHYEIDSNNTCYIYAVQNNYDIVKDNKIMHEIYSKLKNLEIIDCHPRHVYSLILFINILLNKGITKICVPVFQVLSYRYHELLSMYVDKELSNIDKYDEDSYKIIRGEYDKYYQKQDLISKIKTDGLINIFKAIEEYFPELEFSFDFEVQDFNIVINKRREELKKLQIK